ncbi:helix-turn-helix transcriptional regulator [Curtobacterium sp. MCPF17_002]|uniref:helix-turn-helix domain-containing protein n=1 Tax=Curtobacterium sp. MCPF17_002 TaxID=2175645 RepID=UPI000DAA53F2|nr:helix-turn-helix transcriptional regulator [Curtobacterium sp. MCPF17_002]WIB77381.1 helix-turn-helix transcriptional regulator [Curtobacterium sp. MCPF17_002]
MNDMRITELRRLRGWTQERLAEESGVAARTVQRIEGGNDGSLESLSAIARALGVPVRDLFAETDAAVLQPEVRGHDERAAVEQERRDAFRRAWRYLFSGTGVGVSILTVVLISAHVWPGVAVLVVGAYWAGGALVGRFVMSTVIEPWLDRRYPLSRAWPSA